MVRCVKRFYLSSRPQPAHWGLADRCGDRLFDLPGEFPLLLQRVIGHSQVVGCSVAQPLTPSLLTLFSDFGVMLTHLRVKQNAGPDAVFVENVHHSENADEIGDLYWEDV